MSCTIGDERVCLGRDDYLGACSFCIRQMARDFMRSGRIDGAAFAAVMAATADVPPSGREHDRRLTILHAALGPVPS